MQKEMFQLLRDALYPQLEGLVQEAAQDRGGVRKDAAGDRLSSIFHGLGASWQRIYSGKASPGGVRQIADGVSNFQRRQFQKQIQAGVGVEVVQHEAFLNPVLNVFVSDNVRLIKTVTVDRLGALETIVSQAFRAGLRYENIQTQIENGFDVSASQAERIARDQVGKLNGELAELRQRNVGIEEYVWSTSKDERVRSAHAAREGQTFQWNNPPEDGHPGQPIQCRCTATPVMPEDLQDL